MKKLSAVLYLSLCLILLSATGALAAFGAGIPSQAKADFLAGIHDDADTYKIALYVQANATNLNTSAVSYGATGGAGSTSTITGEIANGTNGAAGYTAGGVTISRLSTLVSSTKGVASFGTATFSSLTTPSGGVDAYCIYNTTDSNKIVLIGTLTSTSTTNGTLTITMPTQDSTTGLIRFSWVDRWAVLRKEA